jgi:hypothetical protein
MRTGSSLAFIGCPEAALGVQSSRVKFESKACCTRIAGRSLFALLAISREEQVVEPVGSRRRHNLYPQLAVILAVGMTSTVAQFRRKAQDRGCEAWAARCSGRP